jgi:hypothetical protein
MPTVDPVLAFLAAAVYEKGRSDSNLLISLPPGVTRVANPELAHDRNDFTGFEASAYHYNGQIVISYAGTLPGPVDFFADARIGLGIANAQMLQAAAFYQRVKQEYGDNVVFTGHSLGGGLAALMGVFFNKDAVTFDPAPFRLAATKENAEAVEEYLEDRSFPEDPELAAYVTTEQALAIAVPDLIPGLFALGFYFAYELGHRCRTRESAKVECLWRVDRRIGLMPQQQGTER